MQAKQTSATAARAADQPIRKLNIAAAKLLHLFARLAALGRIQSLRAVVIVAL